MSPTTSQHDDIPGWLDRSVTPEQRMAAWHAFVKTLENTDAPRSNLNEHYAPKARRS